jgi:hypothetical protein
MTIRPSHDVRDQIVKVTAVFAILVSVELDRVVLVYDSVHRLDMRRGRNANNFHESIFFISMNDFVDGDILFR